MLTDYGAVTVELAPLVAAVTAIPASAWVPRGDPESEDTKAIRENDPLFPGQLLSAALDSVGRAMFGVGYVNRVVLSMVPAGKGILPHTDDFGARVQSASYHCHLPLITDPSVMMGGPEGECHLQRGRLYVMDARCRHWVRNPSGIDRVHVLFAYFPESLASAA